MGPEAHWIAVYKGSSSSHHMGANLRVGGFHLDWDRETYPLLSQLDNNITDTHYEIAEDSSLLQTHFLSMLRYMKDHPEITELFGGNQTSWDHIIEYIKTNGIQVYGFTSVTDKDTILKLSKIENISYVYTEPLP